MSNALKALLLSALICPGAGHLYLKSYPKAITFLMVVIGSLGIMVRQALISAQRIIENLQVQDGVLDIHHMISLVENNIQHSDNQLVMAASYCLVISWLVAAIDAYRLGNNIKRANDFTERQKITP